MRGNVFREFAGLSSELTGYANDRSRRIRSRGWRSGCQPLFFRPAQYLLIHQLLDLAHETPRSAMWDSNDNALTRCRDM